MRQKQIDLFETNMKQIQKFLLSNGENHYYKMTIFNKTICCFKEFFIISERGDTMIEFSSFEEVKKNSLKNEKLIDTLDSLIKENTSWEYLNYNTMKTIIREC